MLPTLVLTAGTGTRLDPLTRLVAKPAVPVAGRALVERVLAWLGREGVTDVVLNLHHRPATITTLVGDGTHLNLRVRYSWEQPLLGSAGGPRHALSLLAADHILIVNGDTLCDLALAPMIEAHRASGADVTMALVPNAAPDRYNSVVLDRDDRVRGFRAKQPASERQPAAAPGETLWHFVGVQIARAGVFAPLPDGVPAETVAGVYRDGVATGALRIRGYRAVATFLDVGTPTDYLETALSLAGGKGLVVESGAEVNPSATLTRSIVWSGARVRAGAALTECIVAGVEVPLGITMQRSILMPAHVVRPGDRAEMLGDIAVFHF